MIKPSEPAASYLIQITGDDGRVVGYAFTELQQFVPVPGEGRDVETAAEAEAMFGPKGGVPVFKAVALPEERPYAEFGSGHSR